MSPETYQDQHIVSNECTLETRFQELKQFLTKQKYPSNLIESGIQKARSLNIADVRQVNDDDDNNTLP